MRFLTLGFLLLCLTSYSQIRLTAGFGVNRRMAPQDLFWGHEQQEKLKDQMYSAYGVRVEKKLGKEENGWYLGLSHQSLGIMSTIIRYPGVRGVGSGGSATPPKKVHQRVRYNLLGFSASYIFNKDYHRIYLNISPMYFYQRKHISITKYIEDNRYKSITSYPLYHRTSNIKIMVGTAYGYKLPGFQGTEIGAELNAMIYDVAPVVVNANLQFAVRKTFNLSSDDNSSE